MRAAQRRTPATSPGSTSTPTRRTASRCWRLKTRQGTRSPRSTARPGIRGRSVSSSPRRTPTLRPTRPPRAIPSTVTDVSGALGRGGYEGIQNDGEGDLWIVEDIGGVEQATRRLVHLQQLGQPAAACTIARRPNSFLFRYVPAHKGDLANGKLQVLQVLNSSHQPITFDSEAAAQQPRSGRAPHLRQHVPHQVGDDSRHRRSTARRRSTRTRSRRRRWRPMPGTSALRSSDRRTASSGPAPISSSSSSTRPVTRTRPARRTPRPAAGARSMKLSQSDPERQHRQLRLFYKPDGRPQLVRQRHLPLEEPGHVRPGHGRRAAQPAQRARLRLHVQRHARLLGSGEPPGPLAGRGS